MTTLFDATRPVKVNRNFGAGLLRSLPTVRVTHSAADAAWLVEDNARREAENAMFDRWAAESAAVAAHELGLMAPDAADYISATSIVGH